MTIQIKEVIHQDYRKRKYTQLKWIQGEDNMIIVPGRPVPYQRMTQRGKYVKSNAKRYLAYKDQVAWKALEYRNVTCHEPNETDYFQVRANIYLRGVNTDFGNAGDGDNYLKCAMDSLNGIIYKDDRQVIRGSFNMIPVKKKSQERMEIIVEIVDL